MYVRLDDGVRLFYDVLGSGIRISGDSARERPAILMLHGGPGLDHMVFRPAFDALQEHAQIVYLDHRGCGRSNSGPTEGWHLDQWADDVAAVVEKLGLENPIVLGTSFGGFVAQRFASGYPEKLGGLVLLSTASRVDLAATLECLEAIGGTPARDAAAAFFSDARAPGVVETYFDTCLPLYTHGDVDLEVLGRVSRRPDVMLHYFDKDGESSRIDLAADLQAIRTPTVVVHGKDDPIFPIHLARESFDLLPGSDTDPQQKMRKELVELINCGHLSEQDAPEQVVSAIVRFFDIA